MVPVTGLYPPEPGGGKLSLVVRWPKDVAAIRYERLGKVGPSTAP